MFKLLVGVTPVILVSILSCTPDNPDNSDTENPQTPAEAYTGYLDLEAGVTQSPLGFSADEAGEAFSGMYSGRIAYDDGSQSEVTVTVEPNGEILAEQLDQYGPFPEGLKYVYSDLSGRGRVTLRGVPYTETLQFSVDLTFTTADGRFQESMSTRLRAYGLNYAQLEPIMSVKGGPWASKVNEMIGTFDPAEQSSLKPEVYARDGTFNLYIDLWPSAETMLTSGWVGRTVNLNPDDSDAPNTTPDVIDELAVWGGCAPTPGLDAGVVDCADLDAGAP